MIDLNVERYEFQGFHIPDYMGEGLMRYIEHGILPGSFLTAVLSNDLADAVGRADATNMRNIPAYVAYLWNEAPASCWGSPEKVRAWVLSHTERQESATIITIPHA